MGLKIQKSKKKWYRGKVECDFQFNYNLMWLLLPFVIIALLIKLLFEGIAWVVVKIFDAVTWCFRWVKYFVLLLWNWLKKNEKWWWWLFIPLLLWLFVTVRSCDGNKEGVKPFDIEQQEIIYENSWDDVVVARAYLDNLQFDLNREYTEEEMIEIMMQGNNPTPREALGLN